MRAAIAGGGLAGLACAKRLVDLGVQVTLVEGSPYFGGRAATWLDRDGDWIEQGLHLFLGAYSELKELLGDVGVPPARILRFMPDLRLCEPDGASTVLALNPLRAPLRTAWSLLLRNRYLGLKEKLGAGLLASPSVVPMAVLRLFGDVSIEAWWRRASGNPVVLERFLRPFCRGIQFTEVDQFSCLVFFGLLHQILRDPLHALFGAYLGPRDLTMFAPMVGWLLEAGAVVRSRTKVTGILFDGHVVRGFALADGSVVEADIYVSAVPVWELVPLLPRSLRSVPLFRTLAELPVAPAISVQAWFEGEWIEDDRFALVARSPACVYQDLSRTHFPDKRGSRVSIIVSPADALLDRSKKEISSLALEFLGRADRRLAGRRPRKIIVLKHRQHLLRPLPGVLGRRPKQATTIPNFFLAGDWTEQPFFGSQEGAVRSGNACARAIAERIG